MVGVAVLESMLAPTRQQRSLCKHTISWYGVLAWAESLERQLSWGPFAMGSCLNHTWLAKLHYVYSSCSHNPAIAASTGW